MGSFFEKVTSCSKAAIFSSFGMSALICVVLLQGMEFDEASSADIDHRALVPQSSMSRSADQYKPTFEAWTDPRKLQAECQLEGWECADRSPAGALTSFAVCRTPLDSWPALASATGADLHFVQRDRQQAQQWQPLSRPDRDWG